MSVETWLRSLGLERYTAAFDANDVSEDLLASLTADDLKEIGIASVGHRRRLLDAIAALAGPTSRPVPPDSAPPGPAPERRQVSVVFCDLEGSTALSARLDPEDLSTVIQMYQAQVNEVVRRYDGFIARYLGDGVLIYFGWPQAREDDPERAVRASLDVISAISGLRVKDERLRVRIGIATGLVVIGERIGAADSLQHTAIGETPNRAARLQAIAAPNSVVIDAATRQMIGGLFKVRDLGPRTLAGLSGPVPVWHVLSESGVLSRFEALHGASLPPMIGRDQELGILLSSWNQAKAGIGQAVLVTGEPGIGKSRLVAAFEEETRGQHFIKLRYFNAAHRRDTPWAPFIGQIEHAAGFGRTDTPVAKIARLREVLIPGTPPDDVALLATMLSIPTEGILPSLDLSARRRRERTIAALVWQLSSLAKSQPLVVIAEDIHWSDPTSLEVLDRIMDILADLPVLLVLTFRPEFTPAWSGRAGVKMITLNRLPPRETGEIALHLAAAAIPSALIERLVTRSDGIPLFIEELTRAVLEAGLARDAPTIAKVPDTLQASLLARLDRLPAAKSAAQIGSVIGRSFSHDLVAAIADVPEGQLQEGLDQLVEAGLAFSRGTPPELSYQFKHALVQDAAYQSMVRPRRAALHAANVTVLEDEAHQVGAQQVGARAIVSGDMRGDAALLAHHSDEAGLSEKAIRYFLAAGEEAAGRGSLEEAHALLIRGQTLAEANPTLPGILAWQTRYQFAIGEVLGARRFSASPEAGEGLARAVALAKRIDPADPARDGLLARTLWGYFVHRLYLGEFDAIRDLSEELQTLGRERRNPGIATLGAITSGTERVYRGEFVAARAIFHETLEQWRANDRPESARKVADALGMDPVSVLLGFRARQDAFLGLPDTAVTDTRQAMARARDLGHVRSYMVVLGMAFDAFGVVGADEDLREATAEWGRLAAEQGFQFYLSRARYTAGWVKVRDGDAITGRDLIETAMGELDSAGVVLDVPQVSSLLADARVACGDPAGALMALDQGLAIAKRTGGIWWNPALHEQRAAIERGAPELAEADYRDALASARGMAARAWELRAATGFAGFLEARGRQTEAREILAPVLASFTEGLERAPQRSAAALLARLTAGG